MARNGVREPLRANGANESTRLLEAEKAGPFVAWRDKDGELQIHALGPRTPATIGRAPEGTVWIEDRERQVSREHAELTVRVHENPKATCVYLLDYSWHGTEHRTVVLGNKTITGDWQRAPRPPARAWQLDAGTHDVRLAGEHCLLVGGVPVDDGATLPRENGVPDPTVRQRHVLVELCRPAFEAPDKRVAPPTNGQIRARLVPQISEARVSDLLSEMYVKYGLEGTPVQMRMDLIELAREHALVDASDYR